MVARMAEGRSLTVDELAGIGPQDVHADDHSCALLEDQLEEALRREHTAAQARRVGRLACPPTSSQASQQPDENSPGRCLARQNASRTLITR